MKKLNPLLCIILLIITALSFANCGTSDDPSLTDIYLPDFSKNWVNNANAEDKFFFLNAPVGQPTGDFTGNEVISDVQVATLAGTFDHSKVTFVLTFKDNSPSKTYTGTMTGTTDRVLTLSSGGQPLVLKQQ
jgi:hypothetical protein